MKCLCHEHIGLLGDKIAKFEARALATYSPDDLDTRKSTGTSCQIEIHFMIKTTEYLL
jgi:hypothetical protein